LNKLLPHVRITLLHFLINAFGRNFPMFGYSRGPRSSYRSFCEFYVAAALAYFNEASCF
jgi:hypothetical protein